jgi:hypothetical protein
MQRPDHARVLRGNNPFDVAPERDAVQPPATDVPLWNETWFFSTWSPENEIGLFVHAGVHPTDPTVWYAQVIVYLPGEELLVDRSFGRSTPGQGPSTGSFTVTIEEPLHRWRLRFDGAGERTTPDATGRGPVGAGPSVPLSFDVTLTAAGPLWDLFAATGMDHLSWAGMHHEQNTRSRGTMRVDGAEWDLDGYGFRDHSTGPRDFTRLGGDRFWGFVSPTTGRGCQGIMVWNRDGELELSSGAYYLGDEVELIDGGISLTGLADTFGNPTELEIAFTRADGQTLAATGRILHTVTISILDPNSNVNGTWLEGDPLILAESQVRFDWPDGDVLYGHLERVARLSSLDSPVGVSSRQVGA